MDNRRGCIVARTDINKVSFSGVGTDMACTMAVLALAVHRTGSPGGELMGGVGSCMAHKRSVDAMHRESAGSFTFEG